METVVESPDIRRKTIPDSVLGMIFLLTTEGMFFAGLISAYIVHRASAPVWPPYGQPRLPLEITAVNTVLLLLSALTLYLGTKKIREDHERGKMLLRATIFLGACFVAIQGTEWVRLVHFGMTTSSSLYGAFFYLLIGSHAVHVFAGLLILFYLMRTLRHSEGLSNRGRITSCSLYWYFVVAVWPILYILVYFN